MTLARSVSTYERMSSREKRRGRETVLTLMTESIPLFLGSNSSVEGKDLAVVYGNVFFEEKWLEIWEHLDSLVNQDELRTDFVNRTECLIEAVKVFDVICTCISAWWEALGKCIYIKKSPPQ